MGGELNFGVLEDDYIRDQVIEKCYSSHLTSQVSEEARFGNSGLSVKDCKGAGGHKLSGKGDGTEFESN